MSRIAGKKNSSATTPALPDAVAVEPKLAGSKLVRVQATEAKALATPTGEPAIHIDSDVTRRIRQHARAHLKTEVCGVLIGESTGGVIEIRASIEALNAAQAGTHVTFTQDAWEEIYKVKDDLYPDERIVGWYHSHPGFGIFLSEHDLFIQENFFSSPGQVAWVYDPHSDDEGCFGWVAGKVARLTSVSTLYRSGDPVEHATKGHDVEAHRGDDEEEEKHFAHSSTRSNRLPLWAVISRTVLTHLTVLLAGFAIAFFLFPRLVALVPDPASASVMVFDYHELRSYLDGKGAAPKPLDLFEMPASMTGHALPGTLPNPATAPLTVPQSAPAPGSTVPPPVQPTSPQPTNPQPADSGSHK